MLLDKDRHVVCMYIRMCDLGEGGTLELSWGSFSFIRVFFSLPWIALVSPLSSSSGLSYLGAPHIPIHPETSLS